MAKIEFRSHEDSVPQSNLTLEQAENLIENGGWLDIKNPGDQERSFLLSCGFHPLAVEDCFSEPVTRFYVYDDHKFLVVKARDTDSDIDTEYVFIFVRKNLLVTVRHSAIRAITDFKRRHKSRRVRNRTSLGATYLVYEFLDAIADDWYNLLEMFNERLEDIEDRVIDPYNKYPNLLEQLHDMKQDLREVSKSTLPLRRTVRHMLRPEEGFTTSDLEVFFFDLSDQIGGLTDRVENLSAGAASTRETYLSQSSMILAESNQRLTEVMTTLTIMSAVLLPLTLIAGIFGMNVEAFGSDANPMTIHQILILMSIFAVLMLSFFWARGWLKR